ncbi:MAG: hypothetical protein ACKVW3_06080 [Phycisphaerales bacterium]
MSPTGQAVCPLETASAFEQAESDNRLDDLSDSADDPPLEVEMTVGIAALCDERKTLVLVSDYMRSFGNNQSEMDNEKIRILCLGWRFMSAGKAGIAELVFERARQRIQDGATDIPDAVELAYSSVLRVKKKRFPNAGFSLSVILCGFPKTNKKGEIYVVSRRDGLVPARCGFAAIGIGARAARASLLHCKYEAGLVRHGRTSGTGGNTDAMGKSPCQEGGRSCSRLTLSRCPFLVSNHDW